VWADIRAQRPGGAVDDAWEVHLFYEQPGGQEQQVSAGGGGKELSPPPKRVPPKPPSAAPPAANSPPAAAFPNRPAGKLGSQQQVDALATPALAQTSTMHFTTRVSRKLAASDGNKSPAVLNALAPAAESSGAPEREEERLPPAASSPSASFASPASLPAHVHRGGFRAVLRGSLLCADHALRYAAHGSNGSWRKEGLDPQEALLMTGQLPRYPRTSRDALSGQPRVAFHGYGVERRGQWGVFTGTDGASSRTTPELGSYFMFYDELYHCIARGGPPPVHARETMRLLAVLELAKRSSLRGEVLDFRDDEHEHKHE
jgi:hypothetical protein